MGTPEENADAWKSLGRRMFTPEEEARIIEMAPSSSLLQIAEALGSHKSSVQSACRRLGVTTKGGKGGWHMQTRNRRGQQ